MLEKYKKNLNCGNVVFYHIYFVVDGKIHYHTSGLNIHPAKTYLPFGSCPNPLCCVFVTCVFMRQHELLSNFFSQIKGMCLKC